jgi:hypothetical protein
LAAASSARSVVFALVQKLVDGEFGSSPRPAKAACACTLIEVTRRRTIAIGKDFNCGPLCVPKCLLATLGAKNAALKR